MELKLIIKLDDKEITLTEEEARSLYFKLNEMYGTKTYPPLPFMPDLPTKWPDPIITCDSSWAKPTCKVI